MPKAVGMGEDLVAEPEEPRGVQGMVEPTVKAEQERLSGEWSMVEPMVKVEEERPGGERPMAEAEMECYAALGPGGVEMTASSERPGGRSTDQEQ